MKQKRKSKIVILITIFAVIFYFIIQKERILINEVDENKIEDFDIILSKGQSVQSKLISIFKLSIEDYSHIGMMIKENHKVFVLHSTPDGTKTNAIRFDDLQTFFDLSSVSDYTVLRYHALSQDLRQKLKIEFERYKNSQVPFDSNFNNFDHRKIYCSELVCIIFKNSGLSSLQEFNLTKPIYPKYFFKMDGLIAINSKKTSP